MSASEIGRIVEDKEILRHHPIMVIGGNGNIGMGLCDSLVHQFGQKSVVSVSRSSQIKCEISDWRSVRDAVRTIKPSLIIHLAGATDVNQCEREPEWAWKLNFDGVRNVLNAAERVPMVLFSTDFVFDGTLDTPKRETDQPNPVNEYGLSKHAGECIFLDSDNPGLIARISYPWYSYRMHTFYPTIKDTPYWISKSLNEGRKINVFDDVIGNWTSADYLQQNMLRILKLSMSADIRLIHLGAGAHTPLDVAHALDLKLHGQTSHSLIEKVSASRTEGVVVMRPERGGLDTSLAESLGINFPDIIDEIESGRYFA